MNLLPQLVFLTVIPQLFFPLLIFLRYLRLHEINEVCKWMKTTEDEQRFMRSRLMAVNKDIGKDKMLSVSTISTFAMAIMVLLKYIMHEFRDDDVQKPVASC